MLNTEKINKKSTTIFLRDVTPEMWDKIERVRQQAKLTTVPNTLRLMINYFDEITAKMKVEEQKCAEFQKENKALREELNQIKQAIKILADLKC